MPLYEYECKACKRRFERRQSVHDEPIRECPTCGGETHKVIHPVGIVFKGSGFYVTDNRSTTSTTGVADVDKPSKTDDSAKKEDSAKPASSESSTDSKPAVPSSSSPDAK